MLTLPIVEILSSVRLLSNSKLVRIPMKRELTNYLLQGIDVQRQRWMRIRVTYWKPHEFLAHFSTRNHIYWLRNRVSPRVPFPGLDISLSLRGSTRSRARVQHPRHMSLVPGITPTPHNHVMVSSLYWVLAHYPFQSAPIDTSKSQRCICYVPPGTLHSLRLLEARISFHALSLPQGTYRIYDLLPCAVLDGCLDEHDTKRNTHQPADIVGPGETFRCHNRAGDNYHRRRGAGHQSSACCAQDGMVAVLCRLVHRRRIGRARSCHVAGLGIPPAPLYHWNRFDACNGIPDEAVGYLSRLFTGALFEWRCCVRLRFNSADSRGGTRLPDAIFDRGLRSSLSVLIAPAGFNSGLRSTVVHHQLE